MLLHLDGFITFTLAWAAEKRQTAFLGVIRTVLLDDLEIEHHRVCNCRRTRADAHHGHETGQHHERDQDA